MKTLIVIGIIVAAVAMVLRYFRKREIEAFKDADMIEFHTFAQQQKVRASEPDPLMARAEAYAAMNPDLVTLKREAPVGDDVDLVNVPDPSLYVGKASAFDEVTRNMMRHLNAIVPGTMTTLMNVRLSEFASTESGDAFRLSNTAVAYLVCDASTLGVICGLQHRDTGGDGRRDIDFVKTVFTDIGLPLLEFPVKNDISESEIRDQLETILHGHESQACPRCGEGMSIRRVTKGKNAGGVFWVCGSFPGCRGVLRV